MIAFLAHLRYTLLKRERDTRFQHDSREDVMRMTPEALHTWSQHLGLSPETEALIASIRSSPPVRRVSGRAGNITGRYPSPKMGVSSSLKASGWSFGRSMGWNATRMSWSFTSSLLASRSPFAPICPPRPQNLLTLGPIYHPRGFDG
jgi:hypothetical protein